MPLKIKEPLRGTPLTPHLRGSLLLGLLAGLASCVPVKARDGIMIVAQAAPAPAALAVPDLAATALKPVSAEEALAANQAIPFAELPNPAPAPFIATGRAAMDERRALDCLTSAIYYEAASESDEGQRAVAQVVLNRVRHPAYPSTVCGVVFQGSERSTGCQFTFTCDGSLARTPSIAAWSRARRIAADALSGATFAPVGYATHYHTQAVLPYWASSLAKTTIIGAHIFYRFRDGRSAPAAFRSSYAGREPDLSGRAFAAAFAVKPEATGAAPSLSYRPVLAGVREPRVYAAAEAAPIIAYADSTLPESRVREAYRNSGAIRATPLPNPAPAE